MEFPEPSRAEVQASCSDPGPEDGLDPRTWLRPERPQVKNRKALQLCSQVMRTLQLVLAGECGDDWLRELSVTAVEPAPHAGRLVVTLALLDDRIAPAEALARLHRAGGKLRSEVAAAIHRRKAPLLVFRMVGFEQLGR
jgi:ribosome-binding factor A